MAVGVIVNRKLSFDVRQRDISSNSYVQSVSKMGIVEICVDHQRIVAVLAMLLQELLAEPAFCCSEVVVDSEHVAHPKSPIEMIRLHGVRLPFDVRDELIQFEAIRV